jgi:metal-responsive CopG/Arc/MetJ family transcriptional regulator
MSDTFVNTKMDDETIEKLDQMVKADDSDRSKFIRKLIRQEYDKRASLGIISIGELPGPEDADRPALVTVQR